MPRLILFRHAKSSWDYPELSDFERPLNDRGRRNAPMMAEKLLPYLIGNYIWMSSPALRAAKTAQLAAERLQLQAEKLQYNQLLYDGSPEDIWNLLKKQTNALDTIVLFGHHETLAVLLANCCQGKAQHLPTAGFAVFDWPGKSWRQLTVEQAQMLALEFPKKYKA